MIWNFAKTVKQLETERIFLDSAKISGNHGKMSEK